MCGQPQMKERTRNKFKGSLPLNGPFSESLDPKRVIKVSSDGVNSVSYIFSVGVTVKVPVTTLHLNKYLLKNSITNFSFRDTFD